MRYPAFISRTVTWPVADSTEQLILQEHDNRMLERSVRESRVVRRGVQARDSGVNPGGRVAGAVSAAAFQQHLRRGVLRSKSISPTADRRPSVFGRAAFPRG